MLLSSPSMNLRASIRWLPCVLRGSVAAGLVLLLLAIAPFAVAQDVHHELAAADHDGHEHSDTDLCQWVKHHTAGSLDVGAPLLTAQRIRRSAGTSSGLCSAVFRTLYTRSFSRSPLQLVTSFASHHAGTVVIGLRAGCPWHFLNA